jgi:hypothetical protein
MDQNEEISEKNSIELTFYAFSLLSLPSLGLRQIFVLFEVEKVFFYQTSRHTKASQSIQLGCRHVVAPTNPQTPR